MPPLKIAIWVIGSMSAGALAATATGVIETDQIRAALFGSPPEASQTDPAPQEASAEAPAGEAATDDVPADPASPSTDNVADAATANDGRTRIAALNDAAEPPTLTDGVAGGDASVAEQIGKPDEAMQAAQPAVPRFDILRVEPDGSVLVAGNGPLGASVEIVTGARTLAETMAGPGGDFVAVLDEPLEPGDYQLVIRATTPEGSAVTSAETAIVSIPEDGGSDVLALVEAPGNPSRLISTPQPASPALVPVEVAPNTEDETATATADTPVTNSDAPVVAATDTPPEPDPTVALAGRAGDAAASDTSDDVATLDTGDLVSGMLPAIDPRLAPPPTIDDEPVETAALDEAQRSAGPELATEEATTPSAASQTAPPLSLDVRIEAVEIDGSTVFVAGSAAAGTRLRVYANDILLGDTVATEQGRFLVEVRRDLPVGDYIIRADAIDPSTARVLMRAAVPFNRSVGERLAAVAIAPSAVLPSTPPPIPFDELVPQTVLGELSSPPALPEAAPAATVDVPQALGVLQGPPPLPGQPTPPAQAGLVPVDRSVIIRRGDTLWQISRRVYGQGVKYTTIYLANQEQIADPDRIWPGQIFGVPDEAAENAEAVHRQLRARN